LRFIDAARRLPTNATTLISATGPFPSVIGLHLSTA
jgi:hypothetical protein